MMLILDDLVVTQSGLRNTAQLDNMIEFTRRGGTFTLDAMLAFHVVSKLDHEPAPIHIAQLPGQLYVHDGHHRLVAKHLAGHAWLSPDEYTVVQYTWEDYYRPCLKKRWYTPFHPELHVRVPDLECYRGAIKFLQSMNASDSQILSFIYRSADLYAERRTFSTIKEMCEAINVRR